MARASSDAGGRRRTQVTRLIEVQLSVTVDTMENAPGVTNVEFPANSS